MSQRDFDNYLAFMARMLRLSEHQRQTISDELRDHLDERLAELRSQGVSHDDAVAQALEEFGDAAGLAAEFSRIASLRQRRFIMRITLSSLAAAAAVVFLTFAFAPATGPGIAPSVTIAQPQDPSQGPSQPSARTAAARPAAQKPDANADVEKVLSRRIDAEYEQMPLSAVLEHVRETLGVNMVVDWNRLAEAGINKDATITLELKDVTARKVLELALRPLHAVMVIDDGIVMITSAEAAAEHREIRVYNCRDLVRTDMPTRSSSRSGGYSRRGSTTMSDMAGMGAGLDGSANPFGRQGGFGPGGFGEDAAGGGISAPAPPRALAAGDPDSLLTLIIATIDSGSWETMGGGGSIQIFDGLLVINHTTDAHRKVADLLRMVREAAAEDVPAAHATETLPMPVPTPTPPGGRLAPGTGQPRFPGPGVPGGPGSPLDPAAPRTTEPAPGGTPGSGLIPPTGAAPGGLTTPIIEQPKLESGGRPTDE